IPEMKNLQNIDYALLPVSGEYVMNAEEAASAANMIRPKIAVPMHYNAIVGSVSDAERFKSLCKCQVKIMEKL
ncbi:MAG: MBL fold metallo-hydrolase, partial [Candidatus Woesearchaeota archaeon]